MSIEDIIDLVCSWDGTFAVTPEPGDDAPEIAWGDTFLYYAPDGKMPAPAQPFATIVTKNYPDDEASRHDRPEVFRVNIAAGRDAMTKWASDQNPGDATDPSELDRVFVHPVYGAMGWLAALNPGPAQPRPPEASSGRPMKLPAPATTDGARPDNRSSPSTGAAEASAPLCRNQDVSKDSAAAHGRP
jgi:Family of unknown function (DUF6194)